MGEGKHFGLVFSNLELHKKGCVTKHQKTARKRCDYTKQGYDHIRSDHQDVYNIDLTTPENKKRAKNIGKTFDFKFGFSQIAENLFTSKDPTKKRNKEAWWIPGGANNKNFKTANLPYLHQYHHLLPGNVLHEVFGYRELGILMLGGYNLNDGWNLIILPMQYKIAKIMKLPQHLGSHPEYDAKIRDYLKGVINDIKEVRNEEGHPTIDRDNVSNVKKDLDEFEEYLFGEIITWGACQPGIPIQDVLLAL